MGDQTGSRNDNTELVRSRLDQAWRQMTARLQLLELEEHRKVMDLELKFQQAQARCYGEENSEEALESAYAEHCKEFLSVNSSRARAAKEERVREIVRDMEKQVREILDAAEEGTVHPALLEQARHALWSVSGCLATPEGQGT